MKLQASTKNLNDRLTICKKCKHFRKSTQQCKKCGCFMQIKARIAFTKCPIDKWDRETEITSAQLSILRRIFKGIRSDRVDHQENINLTNIYNEIFGMNKKVTSCGSCVKQTVEELRQIYEAYEERTK